MESVQGESKYSSTHSKLRHCTEMNSHLQVQTVLPPGKNPGIQRMGGCVGSRGSQHVSGEEKDFYCPYWVSMCIKLISEKALKSITGRSKQP